MGGLTYLCTRVLEPEDESGLEGKVEWDVVKYESEGETLDQVETSEDDPISEPWDVILMAL